MPQFAILAHRVGSHSTRHFSNANQQFVPNGVASESIASGPVHWDWLFAPTDSSPLWTWATDPGLPVEPGNAVRFPSLDLSALRLPDHRRRYLEFEGDIGQDRGEVKRLVRGHYQIRVRQPTRMEFTLQIEQSEWFLVPDRIEMTIDQSDCGSSAESPVWTVRTGRSSSDSLESGSVAIL